MAFSNSDEVQNCATPQFLQVYQRLSRYPMYIRLPCIHSFLVILSSRINDELQTIESKQGIRRWTKDSDVYKDLKRMEDEKEKNRIIESIGTCARERWFLLNLKAKFAGMTIINYRCTHTDW